MRDAIRESARAFVMTVITALLSVIAFIVGAWWLIFREPDDHPYLDEVDDDSDSVA